MGFDWDAYKGGGNYVTAAEKKVITESGIPFKVVGIRQVFKFESEQFELTLELPNPETGEEEERILSFTIGSGAESRDRMLQGMAAHFEEGGEPLEAKLEKVGRAYFLRQA